jgi:excisionase family DNA binding protein
VGFESVEKWLTYEEAAALLGVSKGKVARLVEDKHLFSVRIDKQPQVPAELIANGEPLPSIRGTLIVLEDAGFDMQQAAEWLYEFQEELNESPMQSLLRGRKSAVRRLAQALAI